MLEQLRRIIVGQADVIEQILAAIFTRGHCLLVGVPGLAKTLMVSSISQILSTTFKRIQFTPDLMPSDITGTMVLDELPDGKREFRFVRGPIFANVVLADEINRTPPKDPNAPDMIKRRVDWGAGPRAGQFLVRAGQAFAAMDGRPSVAIDDIKKAAIPVMRHRVSANFQAQAEGKSSDDIVVELLK